MPVKTGSRPLPDTYLELIKEFPLVHILDNKTMITAQGMIDRLLAKDLDKGAQQYLDVLTDLVEKYEDEHEPIPDASEGGCTTRADEGKQPQPNGACEKGGDFTIHYLRRPKRFSITHQEAGRDPRYILPCCPRRLSSDLIQIRSEHLSSPLISSESRLRSSVAAHGFPGG